MGSKVSASHRLMEAVGQQVGVGAKGEEGTAFNQREWLNYNINK